MKLKGVGGSLPILGKGTLQLRFLDDKGHVHEHLIRDAYYAPRLRMTLLSPKQWSEQGPIRTSGEPVREWLVRAAKTILSFEGGTKVVPYDPDSNLPILYTKPGYKQFQSYITSQHLTVKEARLRPTALTMKNAMLPPETVTERLQTRNEMRKKGLKRLISTQGSTDAPATTNQEQLSQDLQFEAPAEDTETTPATLKDMNETDKRTLMLRWHYRLGHMPFRHLKAMAKNGLLDKRLATIQEMPLCAGCQFGKQSRRAWRHRSKKKNGSRRKKLRKARRPGEVVSVDTMNSLSVPGLKQQMRGKPTLSRYNYATVFVDHFSSLEYVHLHERNDGDSILEAKLAFECYSHGHDVKIHHYHCDNGIFADNAFRTACKAANQTVSFCGVNAHHQSGRAEKRIRDIRDCARSMILLAKHNWPAAITAHLWPFAMIYASVIRASTLREGEQHTPLQKFLNTSQAPEISQFHTFGCPVYNLEPDLQSGNPLPNKWCDRSRVGIFLGLSRKHASSVSLILNPDTGLVSPQFHVKHDERFETIDHPAMKNIGKWQGETQIHRMRPKKQQRPNKRRKVTIVEPLNGPVTGTTPSPAEAIASTPPTPSEANDGPTTVATGDAQRQQKSTSENLVEATTNGTQTTANPPVEATTNGVSPAEATANGERIGDLLAEDTANEGTDDLNFEQRNPDSPHVEASKATLQHEDAQLQRESGAQVSCRKCKKRKAVSEGDHHEGKPKRKRREVVPEGDEASPEGDLSAMTMRLKTHKSVSQKRKRTREQAGTDILVTTNLLEERRNEIELSIHTYKTTTARRIHAEELIRESMTENPF